MPVRGRQVKQFSYMNCQSLFYLLLLTCKMVLKPDAPISFACIDLQKKTLQVITKGTINATCTKECGRESQLSLFALCTCR